MTQPIRVKPEKREPRKEEIDEWAASVGKPSTREELPRVNQVLG